MGWRKWCNGSDFVLFYVLLICVNKVNVFVTTFFLKCFLKAFSPFDKLKTCWKNYLIHTCYTIYTIIWFIHVYIYTNIYWLLLYNLVDGLLMCWNKTTGHLASYKVYTFHLINQMLRPKSQRCASFFISILKPAFLKISIIYFRIRSVFCFNGVLKTTIPSSLYNPVDCLSNLFDSKIVYGCRQARRFWHHQNCHGDVETVFWILYFFSSNVRYHCVTRIS